MAHVSQFLLYPASLIAFALCLRAWIAYRRSEAKPMLFLMGSFGIFGVKLLVMAMDAGLGFLGHNAIESFSAVMDLLALGLLATPLFLRK